MFLFFSVFLPLVNERELREELLPWRIFKDTSCCAWFLQVSEGRCYHLSLNLSLSLSLSQLLPLSLSLSLSLSVPLSASLPTLIRPLFSSLFLSFIFPSRLHLSTPHLPHTHALLSRPLFLTVASGQNDSVRDMVTPQDRLDGVEQLQLVASETDGGR